MIRIRKACLSDYHDIWQVHASDIDQWVDDQGQLDIAAWENSNMAQRWLLGGPWMSPETCAIHLNALLLAGQTPLVARRGQKILGEAELFMGEDAALGGLNLNISVLYVHRQARGQRIGSALLTETLRRARVYNCRAVTVHNPSLQAESLYKRFGLAEEQEQCVVTIPVDMVRSGPDNLLHPVPWPREHQPLGRLKLWAGSYQSSVQCWQQLAWALSPGLYALPLKPVTDDMTFASNTPDNPAYLCLRPLGDGQQADLYVWSLEPDLDLVAAAIVQARQLGIRQVRIVAGQRLALRLQHRFGGQSQPGHKRLICRLW